MSEERHHGPHGEKRRPRVSVSLRDLRWIQCPLWLLLLVPLVGGCARLHAKTMPDGPPLDVPAPPPRVVEPTANETPRPSPLPEEPRRPPVRPRAAVPPRVEAPRSDAKPEAPKLEAASPADAPKAADEAARQQPAATLQTTQAAEQAEVERAIRTTMARATADLNRINYRALNAGARTQYDTAKRFVEQAEDAIRQKNLVFARNVADKAAAIAIQLGGR